MWPPAMLVSSVFIGNTYDNIIFCRYMVFEHVSFISIPAMMPFIAVVTSGIPLAILTKTIFVFSRFLLRMSSLS